ncbi:phosphonate C-P lyase system protein PhnG [Roseobacter weihaiensis]|uniref:phosphonate C-P lyase system protein PhnG n=1 Tax=Roseobacter weihaiensis TaxID=2763262 RepID=UPI001D0BCC43|nr:phosphonate C-P lyase system protein PhnG [Roseobacter sp. H9]
MLDETLTVYDRKSWLSLLATARAGRAKALLDPLEIPVDFTWLRRPEIGSVMIRGRAGGTGAPFNLGEATVTRCSLKLAGDTVGHGYVQGRAKADAQTAALIDALMQTPAAETLTPRLPDVLRSEQKERRHKRASKAAATKVDFFTMAPGEG